jgi:hypothetical protein
MLLQKPGRSRTRIKGANDDVYPAMSQMQAQYEIPAKRKASDSDSRKVQALYVLWQEL